MANLGSARDSCQSASFFEVQKTLGGSMINAARQSATVLVVSMFAIAVASSNASAQKKYDTGASDTEIKIGNIMPYSGPASPNSTPGKIEAAYFKKINDEGGVNGRKITFISYDDAYSPPKTVEQARKLVEDDEVLLIFNPLGTPTNAAIQKYMNAKKVPQLFLGAVAAKWNDLKNFPWTMGFQPNSQFEGRIFAKYLLKEKPDGKIAILYENNDYGRDYLKGMKDGLGANAASMVVIEEPFENSEPTVDSHIVKFKSSGADIFFNVAGAKFAAQGIKKMNEIGWQPLHILISLSSSIGGAIKPAGFEISQGIVSSSYIKDPNDPRWKDDAGMKELGAFLDKYYPEANRADSLTVVGYVLAQTMVQVLKQCGDDLTRDNVMKQAASLKDLQLGLLLPGIKISTGPDDYAPLKQMQLMRLKGQSWELFGDVISAD
jgi:branched-chain amino acid transport system substrate-binding protein